MVIGRFLKVIGGEVRLTRSVVDRKAARWCGRVAGLTVSVGS
jgi:hypothetical protein